MPKNNIRRKAQLGLAVTDGGILTPVGKNIFLAQGRTHDEGGIGVTFGKYYNPNGNLEIENGEAVQIVGNENVKFTGNNKFKSGGQTASIRVFSSVPFLRGVSPAQLVMGGANPDIVFKAQEEFKDRNRINDDGSRYQTGGQKKPNSAIRTDTDKNVSSFNRAIYSLVDPTMGYPTKGQAVGFGIGAGFKSMRNPNDMVYVVEDSVSDAGWRKRLGLSYDEKFLPANADGSVRLPRNREMEIPTDTTMLKRRIAANEKLAKRYPEHLQNGSVNEKREIVDWALKVDKMALDSLRHTYKTGEPVVINEGAYNSRSLIKDGQLSYPGIMPMNVLQNYTIQYNPKTRQLEYRDVYDFNEFEWGVPGKPFEIKGSIPLKKFGGSTKDDTKTAALKRLRNKFTITGNYGGGMFGGAGAGSLIMTQPEYVNDTITKKYLVPVTQTFNDAFKNARNSGQDEFMFDGKLYNTKLGDNPNNNSAGAKRTSTIIIPIEHKEIRRRKKKFGGNMIYEINGNIKNTLGSYRPKAEWGKKRKVDTYNNFITVDDENYFLNENGVFVPVEETIIKRQPKTVRGASTRRDIAYDRQGNRYQRRSDGSLIRVSPEKGNIATTTNLPELIVTANKIDKKEIENEPIIDSKVYKSRGSRQYVYDEYGNRFYRRSDGTLLKAGKAQPQSLPELVVTASKPNKKENKTTVKEKPKTTETKAYTITGKIDTNLTPRRGNTQVKTASVVDNGPKVTRSPHVYTNYKGETKIATSPYNKVGISKSISGDSTYDVSQLGSPATKQAKAKLNTSSTGGGTQPNTNERWVGQYKPITTEDWIEGGANLAGHLASYFITRNLLNKYPMPQKPIMAPAAKLKTRYNERPEITTIDDAQQMMDSNISRNTQSSSTSLARRQRNLNQGISAKNQVYGKKENIETQLINQDRLNRQAIVGRNVAAFNDWLNKTYVAKAQKINDEISLKNNLLTGMVGSVNNILGNIESRRATNNTIQAIAAANPNDDARLIGNFDYYKVYNKKTGKFIRKDKYAG